MQVRDRMQLKRFKSHEFNAEFATQRHCLNYYIIIHKQAIIDVLYTHIPSDKLIF